MEELRVKLLKMEELRDNLLKMEEMTKRKVPRKPKDKLDKKVERDKIIARNEVVKRMSNRDHQVEREKKLNKAKDGLRSGEATDQLTIGEHWTERA